MRHSRPGQLAPLVARIHAMADAGDPSFTREALATITADTLIVFGDRDPLCPVSLAVDLHDAIPRGSGSFPTAATVRSLARRHLGFSRPR